MKPAAEIPIVRIASPDSASLRGPTTARGFQKRLRETRAAPRLLPLRGGLACRYSSLFKSPSAAADATRMTAGLEHQQKTAGSKHPYGLWLLAAACLFAAIYVGRSVNHDARDGIAFLYTLPVALLGLRFGLRGGLMGAALATVLIVADPNADPLGALGHATRFTMLFAVGAMVGFFTDRARRLERLRACEEEKVRRFFELSQDMLCTANADGFFVDLNPAWKKTLGFSDEELRARPFVDMVHPEDRERTAAEAAALAEGNVTVNFENRYFAKDGSIHWLHWSSVIADDGLIYARATDVTERRAMETELQETAKELARSNDELRQFAHIASHDLNEPLRTIAGFAQLLERRYDDVVDDRGRDYIRRMTGGVERMQTLIAALLHYSRAGRPDAAPEPVDTHAVVSDVLHDLQESIADSGAAVSLGELPTVMGDGVQLQQLFQNLISNGLKFRNGEAPRIEVSAMPNSPGWRFSVADNGIGIQPEERERIFGAFERLHSRDDYAGTGIGLAICKKIVLRHGGEIHVEENPGGGSKFVFTIVGAEGEE